MPKALRHIGFLLTLFFCVNGYSQPPINERYVVDDQEFCVYSSVLSTDSCYYVAGVQTSFVGLNNIESSFTRFNFDGSINDITIVSEDTVGIGFWYTNQVISTLDGKLASLAVAVSDDGIEAFTFLKFNYVGEILSSKFLPEFYLDDSNNGKSPFTFIQNVDSTYYGLVQIQNDTNFLVGIVFFRLSKYGNLLNHVTYYGESIESYNALASASMVQINENRFIIGAAYRKDYADTEDKRQHTKLIVVDSLGEILEEHIYWDDLLSFDCKGLTKTADDGLLYCGRIGQYYPEHELNLYLGRIVKLNSDFEEEWEITLGGTHKFQEAIALNKIKQINETEYVAVGYIISTVEGEVNNYGWLVKFNIDGEKIWERKYLKIPHYGSEHAEHKLYDVDITTDNGFVMVGESTNFYITEDLPGQKAWLIKVDSFGCLVPGCQEFDVGISEDNSDYQSIPLYPNPATNYIFYYHHQDNFQPVEVKIYSTSGRVVQAWNIQSNDITCEVDISDFENGMYILSVTGKDGAVLETQKFVKE